jgi:hypothetical protein
VDGAQRTAEVDALVVGRTVQVTSSRFQESAASVVASCISSGLANITALNIASSKLVALAPAPTPTTLVDSQNLIAP